MELIDSIHLSILLIADTFNYPSGVILRADENDVMNVIIISKWFTTSVFHHR